MNRISKIFGIVIFLVVMISFVFGFQMLERQNDKEDEMRIKKSIQHALLACYSTEGFYPRDIAYLEKNYGLYINHEAYIIHYDCISMNMYPEYAIFTKGEDYDK